MKNFLAPLSLLVAISTVSAPAFAASGSITKTVTAPIIGMMSNSQGPVGMTNFYISNSDFATGVSGKSKTLTLVRYSVAAYPEAKTTNVELCYFTPYTTSPVKCIIVTPGSSSTTTIFNGLPFSYGTQLQLRHTLTGTPGSQLKPSRQESVTTEFSY